MKPGINHVRPHGNDSEFFDLKEFAQIVWQSKRLVLAVAALVTLAALLFGWAKSTYKSEGYFQMEMSFSDFRRLQAALAAPLRWQNFAKSLTSVQLSTLQQDSFINRRTLEASIVPIYPVTRSEVKDVPNAAAKPDDPDITALKISYSAAAPLQAQEGVLVLGNFIRDTMILLDYRDLARRRYTERQELARNYDNEAIDVRYKLEQLKIKKASMQGILREYPDAIRMGDRQPVTITEGNERFLSPITQLVAIETELEEKGRDLPRILRDQQINAIYLRYYEQLQNALKQSTSGNAFLAVLPDLKSALKLNMDNEVERSVFNNISIDNLKAYSQYVEKMSFIAAPLIPAQSTPGILKPGLMGLVVGLILGCVLALFRYFINRTRIQQFVPPQAEQLPKAQRQLDPI
ncbi:hypothetical protein [Glaciimonas immobilis]|uniref:Lipopolysaccharide biosynthesis protein n=1 Tax=Glaciimonas immobilis TaxID=728004 RepID=A0A840S0G4_9BURK|nr:hypothetical protein [Glaciimonas immobilis]KAF3997321.1 hypothetical protein HAV38_14190 [Glaciimonas immobilis]MBB5202374.1 hypothetical protein [Glaciimonas immobilis]